MSSCLPVPFIFRSHDEIRVIDRNAKAILYLVISTTAVHNRYPFTDLQDERRWRLSVMGSGSSCRISRCSRPGECEISCYRHGCDPPKRLKSLGNCNPGSFPAITRRLNTVRKQPFSQSVQQIATCNGSSTSWLRLCDADVRKRLVSGI